MSDSLVIDEVYGMPIPSRGFEAHVLLAREAVKASSIRRMGACYKGRPLVSRANQGEMAFLKAQAGTDALNDWGRRLWGEERWQRMSPGFFSDDWHLRPRFLQLRKEVRECLNQHCEAGEIKTGLLMAAFSLVRLNAFFWAKIFGTTIGGKRMEKRAPIIAIIGADGAGKSTIVTDIREWLAWKIDVMPVYLGSNHGWFKHLRSCVCWVKQRLKKDDHRVLKDDDALIRLELSTAPVEKQSHYPVWMQAAKYYFFAVARCWRLRQAQLMCKKGAIVVTDRYPQSEFPGTYDGPSESSPSQRNPVIRWLHSAELRHYEVMSRMTPDLVIKLNVPFEVAKQRKPDHDIHALKRKTEITEKLCFTNTRAISVLTTCPLKEVKIQVRNHVWNCVRDVAANSRNEQKCHTSLDRQAAGKRRWL
jgi:thymidylate kinase